MDKDSLEIWLRNRQTQEFLSKLKKRFPCDWRKGEWEHINRLRGQMDVLIYMENLDWLIDDG